MKIIITGSSGFIGRNFIKSSYYKNKLTPVSLKNTPIDQVDFQNINSILHLAGLAHQINGAPSEAYFRINSDLTFDLARKAKEKGIRHFIFVSTVKVYGEVSKEGSPWNESSVCNPVDPYGKSKFEAECRISALSDSSFTVSIIRTPIVYGEGVKGNILRLLTFINSLRILPFGGIGNKRSMVYINNLIGLIDRVIEKKESGIFLAGDENQMSTTDLVKIISASMSKKKLIFKLPNLFIILLKYIKPELINRLYASFEIDCSNTNKKLDFKPQISSQEGVAEMVKWYLNNKK